MALDSLVLFMTGMDEEGVMKEFLCLGVSMVSCTDMEEIFRDSYESELVSSMESVVDLVSISMSSDSRPFSCNETTIKSRKPGQLRNFKDQDPTRYSLPEQEKHPGFVSFSNSSVKNREK